MPDNYVKLDAAVQPLDFKHNSPNGELDSDAPYAVTSDDSTWAKYASIFFREGAKPAFSAKPLKDSLLKLPQSQLVNLTELSTDINKAFLKLVCEDCNINVIKSTLAYICDKTSKMRMAEVSLGKELKMSDETVCQIARLTYQNSEYRPNIRAWMLLSLVVSMFTPSLYLAKALTHHLITSAPSVQISALCQ